MRQENKKLLTTPEAMKRLNISRGTFFSRVRDLGIKPANFNPNLRKQHNPVWRVEDLDQIGAPVDADDDETKDVA
jgi:hypothetical protein